MLSSNLPLALEVITAESSVHTPSNAVAAIETSLVISLDAVSTGDGVDRCASQAGAADLLDLRDREALLVVVNSLDSAAEGTALESSGHYVVALYAEDVHAVADPVERDVDEDDDETNHRDEVGDAGSACIGNGALDWREDCPAANAHDEDASTAAGVAAEVGGTDGEDAGVHGCHEEEDDDDACNTGGAMGIGNVCGEGNADGGVDHEDEVRLEEVGDTCSDEAADGEGDEAVGEQAGTFFGGKGGSFGRVVDEEGSDGDLGTDVGELCNETTHHVVLLPQGLLLDDVTILVNRKAKLLRVTGDD